ncbi:hypothetical protein HXX76_015875 [Chlamydomonas incerta]|uniref:Uncharacterized protein n=1 Tax=Chlamydomonas incerta TaxID=51695 RepID=A0A835VMS9_CHLIN|nr:hypothetical protein HXX76_015875 [Chlamydomonas incerta]|eukprot:KAG2422637.1 hypothetical protein HXX76_015875 [Chlamydomonas incerta]
MRPMHGRIQFGGSTHDVHECGDVVIQVYNTVDGAGGGGLTNVLLRNVWYVPVCPLNLISMGAVADAGYHVTMSGDTAYVYDNVQQIYITGSRINNVYVANMPAAGTPPVTAAVSITLAGPDFGDMTISVAAANVPASPVERSAPAAAVAAGAGVAESSSTSAVRSSRQHELSVKPELPGSSSYINAAFMQQEYDNPAYDIQPEGENGNADHPVVSAAAAMAQGTAGSGLEQIIRDMGLDWDAAQRDVASGRHSWRTLLVKLGYSLSAAYFLAAEYEKQQAAAAPRRPETILQELYEKLAWGFSTLEQAVATGEATWVELLDILGYTTAEGAAFAIAYPGWCAQRDALLAASSQDAAAAPSSAAGAAGGQPAATISSVNGGTAALEQPDAEEVLECSCKQYSACR